MQGKDVFLLVVCDITIICRYRYRIDLYTALAGFDSYRNIEEYFDKSTAFSV